ncbi:MAG: N-6 DNA methylase [Planctomycetes bacterium]|nr:N-6 DNA methylase [Planctomycetota bacterium]
MANTLKSAVAHYGAQAKSKLRNLGAVGEPEDQLRAPLEGLIDDLAQLSGFPTGAVTAVGETALGDLKTRPDYAVTVRNALAGFVEIKAPGKGADPRKFKGHDKEQWAKLQSLPNLIYTDGNHFSLWRSGELDGPIVSVLGDVETSGATLDAPPELLTLFDSFFRWEPIPPRSAQELARTTARLCRFLRDEVTEQLTLGSPALTALAADWRKLLFPDASDTQFADGYAQAVTFGLLMARAHDIELRTGLDQAAKKLGRTNSLIGAALRLLTDDASNQETLKTSLGTLTRVLDAVNWHSISKDKPEAWLYFYEEFLAVYDNNLRKLTGSYYTPPEVVGAMVRLVDEVLRSRFQKPAGLASQAVTLADPAVGTGTFLLGVLSRIAATVEADQGAGAVPGAIDAAISRLIAFEMQLGPFAVAQLRIYAELVHLIGKPPKTPARMFVTDTLGNPWVETESLFSGYFGTIGESRRAANKIKREEPITVVIGNPPYKEKAKGKGGWIEKGHGARGAPLAAWIPPKEWGVSAHAKHLRNLYVFFWRWATWRVFDHDPQHNNGVVCFITVAGFLNGPGFQRMRDYLRRTADDVWVIDCSPEGHQPETPTRIFQGVQQPVCIVLVSRSPNCDPGAPATVRYRALPEGAREDKFAALAQLTLEGDGWIDCPAEWRGPFLPALAGDWATYPALDDLFGYNGSGVMPGRTWIIAPDAESLVRRWQKLIKAKPEQKEALFVPHLNHGKLGDRHVNRVITKGLPGYASNPKTIGDEKGECLEPVQYAFRSFDRQWIIPDNRVINRPNPELWRAHSNKQIYLTAIHRTSPTNGPALTITGLIPDLDHYKGSFGGRVFPLWRDSKATEPNLPPKLLHRLEWRYKMPVDAQDIMAYIAAVAAHPAYTARFQDDLAQPGLRIPLTTNKKRFAEAVELGRTIIWLHTFGERCVDAKKSRPRQPPRLAKDNAPRIPAGGAISPEPDAMPDEILYDASKKRLVIGSGYIENVPQAVWDYEVSGKQVVPHWFSYRKLDRAKPPMGDKRPPSELCKIQPPGWLAEYTTELLNVLHVLGRLVELEEAQADLLHRICKGPTIGVEELRAADALTVDAALRKKLGSELETLPSLFD